MKIFMENFTWKIYTQTLVLVLGPLEVECGTHLLDLLDTVRSGRTNVWQVHTSLRGVQLDACLQARQGC